jgi:hypothetical protein
VGGVATASASCDSDCSAPSCGDNTLNSLAGELCEAASLPDTSLSDGICNTLCQLECAAGNLDCDGDATNGCECSATNWAGPIYALAGSGENNTGGLDVFADGSLAVGANFCEGNANDNACSVDLGSEQIDTTTKGNALLIKGTLVGGVAWYASLSSAYNLENRSVKAIDEDAGEGLLAVGSFCGGCNEVGEDASLTLSAHQDDQDESIGSYGGQDGYVVKLDGDGSKELFFALGGEGNDALFAVDTFSDNSFVVVGFFSCESTSCAINFVADSTPTILDAAGGRDIFLAKYDKNGALLWAKSAGGAANDQALAVKTLADGSMLLTGYFCAGSTQACSAEFNSSTTLNASAPDQDIFVARYDSNGTLLWAQGFGSAALDEGKAITMTADAKVVVVGSFCTGSTSACTLSAGDFSEASQGGEDAFILTLSGTDGTAQALQVLGSAGDDVAHSIGVWPDGHVLVGGEYCARQGQASGCVFNGDMLADDLVNQAKGDSWLLHLKPKDGQEESWTEEESWTLNASLVDSANEVALLPNGQFFVHGTFSGFLTYDVTTLGEALSQDLYILQEARSWE